MNELTQALTARLDQLGKTQPDLIREAPVDGDTLRALLRGDRRPTRATQTRIENALDWPEGTVQKLLSGEVTADGVTAAQFTSRVVVELDVPLVVWQSLDLLDQADVRQTARLAGIRRVNEMRKRADG